MTVKILHDESQFTGKASVAALGMFDGVHIGHQWLIREAVQIARGMNAQCVVCTFDRHPLSVVCPERAPKPLLSLEDNLKKFEQLGADYALVKPFSAEFAAMLPEDYIELLVKVMHVKAIVIGENYTFGREGKGNAEMVQRMAIKYGYRAKVVEPVVDEQGMISSTRIRAMLQNGELSRARSLLDIREEDAQ